MNPSTRRSKKTTARKALREAKATAQRIQALSKNPLPYLPQEIQDQIFAHAISPTYQMMNRIGKRLSGTTRALLLVSKRTHAEVLKQIYSNSLFHYNTHLYNRNLPIQALTDRMMHVEISINCWKTDSIRNVSHYDRYKFGHKFQGLIAMFGGNAIARESFLFSMYDCSTRTYRSCPWPYLEAVKSLTGFKSVRVKYDWVGVRRSCWSERNPMFLFMEEAIKEDLEPTLGPASVGSVSGAKVPPRFVEFRPREYGVDDRVEAVEEKWSERLALNWHYRAEDVQGYHARLSSEL